MYKWDDRLKRYKDDKGEFVRINTIHEFSDESIDGSSNLIESFVKLAVVLTITELYKRVQQSLKEEYIRQYLLGHGGRYTMTNSDWGKLGNLLKTQYQFLKRFVGEIATGALSEAEIAMRMRMYFNSARQAYEVAFGKQAVVWGAVEESRITNRAVMNCVDCIGYEQEGWKPVGYFPFPGSGSVCLTNCHCRKEYRNEQGKVYYAE